MSKDAGVKLLKDAISLIKKLDMGGASDEKDKILTEALSLAEEAYDVFSNDTGADYLADTASFLAAHLAYTLNDRRRAVKGIFNVNMNTLPEHIKESFKELKQNILLGNLLYD
jgi:hypothetical protein